MHITQLLPRRPYLLRAFYEWLLDNQLTPHLLVNVDMNGVMVPLEFAHNEQIVLNIAPYAVANLVLGNNEVQFNTCFSGVAHHVIVPMIAVLAIYASENGAGMMFESEIAYEQLARTDDKSAEDLTAKTVRLIIDDDRPDNTQIDTQEEKSSIPLRSDGRPLLHIVK